jgi:hypothetical protein
MDLLRVGIMLSVNPNHPSVAPQFEKVWGRDEGYCAWCIDAPLNGKVVWEFAIDSQGDQVAYACCHKCAKDREVTR